MYVIVNICTIPMTLYVIYIYIVYPHRWNSWQAIWEQLEAGSAQFSQQKDGHSFQLVGVNIWFEVS